MLLSKLLNSLDVIQVLGEPEKLKIRAICNDSREVQAGDLFVAISGYKTNGHNYVEEVIAKGVAAVIIEEDDQLPDGLFTESGAVKILVKNSRIALSRISYEFYERPSEKLKLIGITGTKGKTTTSYIIKHLLETAGNKVGLIGTIANYIGDKKVATKLTTPESHQIHKIMSDMVQDGCSHCVMEVSSHALALNRVDSLEFDQAIFTNITSDHFDFHDTFEGYVKAKKRLFDLLNPKSISIINIDDTSWTSLVKDSQSHTVFYGCNSSALYQIKDIAYDVEGTSFKLVFNENNYDLNIDLIGSFNAYNATAAIVSVMQLGLDWETIQDGLKKFPQVPGRFEVIENKKKKVIIDYSHTSDSLQKALEALNILVKGERKIYTVFGCGGDRDKLKRPEMGRIAEEGSDSIIVTSDNPRTEDPMEIIKDIEAGLKLNKYKVIENRDEAIKEAILNSEEDAVILIAGKGHEDYQEINGVRYPFSDKAKAKEYLALC